MDIINKQRELLKRCLVELERWQEYGIDSDGYRSIDSDDLMSEIKEHINISERV